MQYADSAAMRIDVRLEPTPRRERAAGWLGMTLTALLGFMQDFASWEVVITHIATGDEALRARVRDGALFRVDDARHDLKRRDEVDWLATWEDPSVWR